MASWKDAFSKFSTWKKSRTVVKLTLLPKSEPPLMLEVLIMSVVEESFIVGFGDCDTRAMRLIDFCDASFRIGKRVLEVERPTGDLLAFEEIDKT
jgi:hypothetical protein